MPINIEQAYREFNILKEQEQGRNYEYYLLRQAVKGNFRWPSDWPRHVPKLKRNLCKPITERFATYLMGKGFSYNVERPNTLDYREHAERTEKVVRRVLELSRGWMQFALGAKTGSELGRSIFKVYKKGSGKNAHACFTYCQPDYFYGIPSGDDHLADFSVVYYSYPLDRSEAERMFGPGDYKDETQLAINRRYDKRYENEVGQLQDERLASRRIPVLEVWTKDEYALIVGGVVKYNGPTPPEYRWKENGEGFIPFVVIENSRNAGEAIGEADIAQARELNEEYNQLLSLQSHIVKKWLRPTLVWEGAPQNYAQLLSQTLAGGGALPARLGSKLYFLVHQGTNQELPLLIQQIREAILENAGMSEIALQGTVQGSINTGPALAAQFQPVISAIEKKRTEWENGIKRIVAMLLNVQEHIGDSDMLGEAVINQDTKSRWHADGELVKLSGKDIAGLREITVSWPGVLPKDDFEAARLEMEKAAQGFQSIYTTLEKLGEEYPSDEIARIRMENEDPSLRGEKVAEQLRAQTPLLKAQADAQLKAAEMGMEQERMSMDALAQAAAASGLPPGDEELAAQGDFSARIRQMAQAQQAKLDMEGDEPVLTAGY